MDTGSTAMPTDEVKYYEYMLVYTDDLLATFPEDKFMLVRLTSADETKFSWEARYLPRAVNSVNFPNGVNAWGLSPLSMLRAVRMLRLTWLSDMKLSKRRN
jgi:hypothetical protein